MKKFGLLLLAVVMVTGMAGCSDDDNLEVADMAGTYVFSRYSVSGVTLTPPAISGAVTLTGTGAYYGSVSINGDLNNVVGTFTVEDPNIKFIETADDIMLVGVISDDGNTVTITTVSDGQTFVVVLTRSSV